MHGVFVTTPLLASAYTGSGIYVVLVILALRSLRRRGKSPGWHILACTIALMCVLGTAEVVLQVVDTALALRAFNSTARGDPTISPVQEKSLWHVTDLIFLAEELLIVTNK